MIKKSWFNLVKYINNFHYIYLNTICRDNNAEKLAFANIIFAHLKICLYCGFW